MWLSTICNQTSTTFHTSRLLLYHKIIKNSAPPCSRAPAITVRNEALGVVKSFSPACLPCAWRQSETRGGRVELFSATLLLQHTQAWKKKKKEGQQCSKRQRGKKVEQSHLRHYNKLTTLWWWLLINPVSIVMVLPLFFWAFWKEVNYQNAVVLMLLQDYACGFQANLQTIITSEGYWTFLRS